MIVFSYVVYEQMLMYTSGLRLSKIHYLSISSTLPTNPQPPTVVLLLVGAEEPTWQESYSSSRVAGLGFFTAGNKNVTNRFIHLLQMLFNWIEVINVVSYFPKASYNLWLKKVKEIQSFRT